MEGMTQYIMGKARQTEELLGSSELCGAETARVRELIRRLETQEITVAVIGQFKRGKSTLVNGLLGEKLLPVGIVPVTSAVTRVCYGEKSAAVHFDNGVIRQVAIDVLSDYISEQKNPDNKLGVASVTIHTPAGFLKDGVTLVDTPGVGSVHRHNSDAAYASVKESDAVIFMLSVDSPINEIEIDFLRSAGEYAAKFYFAVNKTDTAEEDELVVYLDYCRRLLCSLMGVEDVQMFPVSAKFGSGLAELKEAVEKDSRTAAMEIMAASAKMKLIDILSRSVSQLNLYWNALNLPVSSFDDKFEKMEECFGDLRHRTEDAVAELNVEADQLESRLEQELRRELQEKIPVLRQAAADAARKELTELYKKGCSGLDQGCRMIDNGLQIRQNEMKRYLSGLVSELFGMEYHYELTELNLGQPGLEDSCAEAGDSEAVDGTETELTRSISEWLSPFTDEGVERLEQAMLADISERVTDTVERLSEAFRGETERLCEELSGALNRILLYREQNAYTVARRIEDLNQLTRKLRRLREELQASRLR